MHHISNTIINSSIVHSTVGILIIAVGLVACQPRTQDNVQHEVPNTQQIEPIATTDVTNEISRTKNSSEVIPNTVVNTPQFYLESTIWLIDWARYHSMMIEL